MVEADVFEVARLFYRTYGYSAYHATAVYEPDLLAEYVRAGRHLATVAVTPSGRVVGHVASKVERAGDVTGSLGLLAVDPAYRGFAVTARLGWAHVARLVESGFVGQYTEAVTVHDRSQRIALKSGGHEVGLILAAQGAGLEYAGFEIAPDQRRAVMMMFGGIGPIGERVVHVPQAYAEVARAVYLACGLPREVDPGSPRKPEAAEGQTRFRLHFKLEGGVAMLTVEEYGDDFDSALQQQLAKLRLNRYDLTLVMLPLGDPRTAFYGNGLDSLGLSFAGVYPEYDNGDVLVLQSLNNVEIHPDSIATASEHGEYIKSFVLDDVRRAAEFTARQQRSHANIARVLDALG